MGDISIFKVTRTMPLANATNISLYDDIQIVFNTDVNPKTLVNGILVINKKTGQLAPGTLSYNANRVASFRPDASIGLSPSTDYDVILKNNIINILGVALKTFSFSFHTKAVGDLATPLIVYPNNMTILNVNPIDIEFKWSAVENATSYVFEVSKQESFTTLEFTEEISTTTYNTIHELASNQLYYWRVRAVRLEDTNKIYSSYSDTYIFIIALPNLPIVQNDSIYYDPAYIDIGLDRPSFDVLESFPQMGFSNVSVNLNTIYFVIDGVMPESILLKAMPEFWVIKGSHVSGYDVLPDYDPTETVSTAANNIVNRVNHGRLNGTWSIVTDEIKNKTYIVFNPNKL